MELGDSLFQALIAHYPAKEDQIKNIYQSSNIGSQGGHLLNKTVPELNPQIGPFQGKVTPHFGKFLDHLKGLLGQSEFLSFIDIYINKVPENNKLIKEELYRLEKESLYLEEKEKEKILALGLQAPIALEQSREDHLQFVHSTMTSDIEEEFKDAKWIVLTTPVVQQHVQKSSATKGPTSLVRDNSLSSTNNFTISLNNLGQNSSMSNTSSGINRSQSIQSSSAGVPQGSQIQTVALAKLAASQAPQKRYGHSALLVKNKMYIFGGLASLQKGGNLQSFYECQLKFASPTEDSGSSAQSMLFQWDKIKAESPKARDSHTIVHAGDALIMFGGSGGSNSFNDLYKFDLRLQKWSKLEPLGDLPAPREGHISKLIGKDKMVVHGGVDSSETSFGDTYILTGISQFIDNSQISSIYTAYIPQYEFKQSSLTPVSQPQGTLSSFQAEGGFSSANANGVSQYLDGGVSQLPDSEITVNTLTPQSFLQQQMPLSEQYQASNTLKSGCTKLQWFKCIDRGQVPLGRDSHSSALINDKLYIFGGQGEGEVYFDDLYSCQIVEELTANGDTKYYADWELIDGGQSGKKGQGTGGKTTPSRPRVRTSHSCTVYKNRYLIIIGGEGELTEQEMAEEQAKSAQNMVKKKASGRGSGTHQNEEEQLISVELEIDEQQNGQGEGGKNKKKESSQEEEPLSNKRMLNDVWVFDTLLKKWHQIFAPMRFYGIQLSKKMKREFEPRMAHSAVSFNQFVVLFGGLSSDSSVLQNDLFVLSLDGNMSGLKSIFENESLGGTQPLIGRSQSVIQQMDLQQQPQSIEYGGLSAKQVTNQIQLPSKQQTVTNTTKQQKQLRITNPEDRKVMSGQIMNQIINYNSGMMHQYFITGAQVTNNIINATGGVGGATGLNHSSLSMVVDFPFKAGAAQKVDSEVQTIDLETIGHQTGTAQSEMINDSRSKLITILNNQNDFKMSSFQRTKFSFISSLADQISWPIQCFGAFIDNSIEAYDLAKQKIDQLKQQSCPSGGFAIHNQKFNPHLDIEINLKNSAESQVTGTSSVNNTFYFEIKDNGPGIHPKHLMETLTSFGHSFNGQRNKSDYNFSEHGISLKINALRLGKNTLIITKTRPTFSVGISIQYLSIGLLSSEFVKKADSNNGYLVCPIVAYEIKNRRITKQLTPESEHFLSMISSYCKAKFPSGDKVLSYAMNLIDENGGTHFFTFNLNKFKPQKTSPYEYELKALTEAPGDIIVNPLVSQTHYTPNHLEYSLRTYLSYLYIEYPAWVKFSINSEPFTPQNPYSLLKNLHPTAFSGEKQEKFAVQFINETALMHQLTVDKSIKIENQDAISQSERAASLVQGMLIYRGNRLIRRLESVIGEEEEEEQDDSRQARKSPLDSLFQFKQNGIVSVFKSKSSTTIDKKDFQDKKIIRKIKEWSRGQR